MKVLVTGGAGFIGSHLVDALLARGDQVVVLDDLSSGHESNLTPHDNLRFVEGSVLDSALVNSCASGCQAVAHLAAVVSVQDSIKDPVHSHAVNLTGTVHVLESARKSGAKVVFASSAAVYGDNGKARQVEGEEADPLSPYGVQKAASEAYLRVYHQLYGVPCVSFRQFNIYGPRQDPSSPYSGVVSIFIKNAGEGRDLCIFGDGESTRDFMFVSDVVDAYLRAFESDALAGQALNIGTGRATTVTELARQVAACYPAFSGSILYKEPRPGDIRHSCADTSRAVKGGLCPESPRTLAEGLSSTL